MSTDTTHIPRWLKASRAEATQEWIAADIERVTGWHITRDRYSKYESGSLPVGPKVLAHFVDYWATRGVPGPDAPVATPGARNDTPSPDVAALVSRIDSLVGELAEDRQLIRDLLGELRQSQAERAETRGAFLATLQALGSRGRRGRRSDPIGEPLADDPLDVAGHLAR